jgi:broad specificity phosphatase PhoE
LNILKILVLLVFISFDKSTEECSNIYLIRHAEKVRSDESDSDPDLNNKGLLRAENWKNYFISKNISRIYSTNYKRTIKTAIPLAENNNLEILIYSSDDIVFETFLKSNEGENTVVVGHSNTIPDFVNNLINEEYYDQIDDLNNSNLYMVSICNSGLTHKLITVD